MRRPWWLDSKTNRRQDERRSFDRRVQPRVSRDRRGRDRRARAVLVSIAALASVPTATRPDLFGRRNARAPMENLERPPQEGEEASPLLGDLPPEYSTAEGREFYESIIEEAAAMHGVDEDLVRAVIQTESGFDPKAVSRVGAKGLMQMMPATAKRMGVEDPFDPRDNIMGGVRYLRLLLDKFKGNVPLALAGYNAGPRKVTKFKGIPPYKETRGYVKKVLREMAEAEEENTAPQVASAAPAPEPKKPSVIYKWTDKRGHLYLSDTPPTGSVPFVVLKTGD
jgi:soluble lytic murein transglycosylase-like protein